MRLKSRLTPVDFGSIRRIFGHFGQHLAPHRGRLTGSALLLLAAAVVTLAQPWPLKIVFDYALLPPAGSKAPAAWSILGDLSPLTLIVLAATLVLALATLRGALQYSESILTKTVGHRVVAQIRLQLFSHIQRLPQSYHDYRETGELMTRLTGDIGLLEELLTTTVITVASQCLLILGMFVIMLTIDWQLALLTAAVAPLFLLAAFRYSPRIRQSARQQRETYGKIVASVQESLAGISQVKSYGQERHREKQISKSMDKDVKANVRTTRLAATYARIVDIIMAVGTALVLWLGARKVLSGALSAGDLLVFLAYVRGIYRPVQDIARLSTKVVKATVRGEKIIEILELEPEVSDRPGSVSAEHIQGEIRFDQVQFAYVQGHPVLTDFSCRIPRHQTTLVIGHTGAGKSTLAKLILRLYDPQEGTILLDGHDIRGYRIHSLRKRITPLAQDTFLFRATIEENIGFGRRHATPDEIREAAIRASAHDFIEKLPRGYQTLVGEGGLTLSGGQRQRISFARAALRQSPVMIFDEPATGLDPRSERAAKDALSEFRRDRTMIIITHRLHFLDLADHVILLANGRVLEEGTPEDLRANGKFFAEFVSHGQPTVVHPNPGASERAAERHGR